MDQVASSVSIPSRASTSPVSSAVAYRWARSATARSPSARRVWSWLRFGSAAVAVVRARCRALVTEATEVSSCADASAAVKPSTSRRMSTARCSGGRSWSRIMNAISTLSRCSYRDSGDVGLPASHWSGYGSSQIGSLMTSAHRRADLGGRPEVGGQLPAGAVPGDVEGGVGGDGVEPGANAAAALELVQPAPGAQQRVLHGVLGVLDRAEHPVAVGAQLALVHPGQLRERVLVAHPGVLEQRRLVEGIHHHAAWTPPAARNHRPKRLALA